MSQKRGRKALNRAGFHVRVAPQTPSALKEKAQKLGYVYGKSGATGELLDAIAEEQLVLVPQQEWEYLKKLITTFREIQLT